MVEVFETNVPDTGAAGRILNELHARYPESRISFDLEDCDKVLRVESVSLDKLDKEEIVGLVHARGYTCMVMDRGPFDFAYYPRPQYLCSQTKQQSHENAENRTGPSSN